jgi:hypothetical protein
MIKNNKLIVILCVLVAIGLYVGMRMLGVKWGESVELNDKLGMFIIFLSGTFLGYAYSLYEIKKRKQ